jgi:cytidylate kinase
VKLLNADIPAIFAANTIHNGRVFRDIAKRRTINLIRVCVQVANSNGLALASIGLTLKSGILMSTPTWY